MDVYYVDHRSALMDLRVLARTAATVFERSGVSGEGHVTMKSFDPSKGSDSQEKTP